MSAVAKLSSSLRSKSVPPPGKSDNGCSTSSTKKHDETDVVTNKQGNNQSESESRSSLHKLNLFQSLKNCKRTTNWNQLNAIVRFQLTLLKSGWITLDESNSRSLSQLIPQHPVELQLFLKVLQTYRKYPVFLQVEFNVASKGEAHSIRHALKDANLAKNCNKKHLPYDYNRVVLEPLPGVLDSDYINASYIDSILKPNAYIATQGPIENTIADFWRMVWEQRSYIIVMLTKVFDFIRVMCCQYWPAEVNNPEIYSPIEVTLLTEEKLAEYTIRTFRIRKLDKSAPAESNSEPLSSEQKSHEANSNFNGQSSSSSFNEERIVHQFHYHDWPTHRCPYPVSLLQFRRRVRIYSAEVLSESDGSLGPTIVHCSDGCGRTGTYLCIDANLELSDEDNIFDVFGYTKKMRQARKGMIESVDQYKFVYEFLEEVHMNGKTWFPVSDLTQQMKLKSTRSLVTRISEYQREYQRIVKTSPQFSIGDCAGGHRIENRDKNRDVATIPPDNHRPYLTTFQSNDSTDYINGVFVDGYTRSREYIVTEWPMPHTVPDCWSLIYDHDCNSVVVLANPDDSSTYPSFWPTEKEKRRKFGPVFTVDLISANHYPHVKSWIFRINKKVVSLTELMSGVKGVPKTTQFFQITCWPLPHKVPTSTNALVELMNMIERWRQRSAHGPVCVISTNGQSRAGVYCAANVAIEQVIQHGEVDVFSAVKRVRRHRSQLVENMTEYKYCYDLILHYVLNYLNNPQS